MSFVREPPTPLATPAHVLKPYRRILFRHPSYDDSNNVFLKLFASNPTANVTDAVGCGLYAQFALDACGVIAGNRWDRWLSKLKDPAITATAAPIKPASMLQRSSSYFHSQPLQIDINIGRSTALYPIVPTFREWRFGHDQLPDS
jgi:hypothetical protein